MLAFLKPSDAHEFKPILAEIEDSPGSPLGSVTLWLILAVILFFILWTCFGEVDVVISGRGKVIPDGRIKVIQPLDTGVIREIRVNEGDYVKKGQLLMTIDPSTMESQLDLYQENLAHMNAETSRLRATAGSGGHVSSGTQGQLYAASQDNLQKQLASKQQQLETISAQMEETNVQMAHTQEMLVLAQERQARAEKVKDIISKDEYEKAFNDVATNDSKLKELDQQLAQKKFQQEQIRQEMAQAKAGFQTQALTELSEKERQLNELSSNVKSMRFHRDKQKIYAPVNGYIADLMVHTVGGVVTPAEKLLTIVPANTPLLIEAQVSNRDIGFVNKAMPVTVKIDTFDFQKYGTIEGKVMQVAHDSKPISALSNGSPMQNPNSPVNPAQEAMYTVIIQPLNNHLMVNGNKQFLTTGLSLTSEINVGKRKIIEFFIYPIIQHLDEGLSVR